MELKYHIAFGTQYSITERKKMRHLQSLLAMFLNILITHAMVSVFFLYLNQFMKYISVTTRFCAFRNTIISRVFL